MSEYQYYEFEAIDRPLTREQMEELRDISSRAEITPTRFTNTYNYGDFRGDVMDLLDRYFDAHVYVANWGSHILMFGLPASAVDADALMAYGNDGGFGAQIRGDRVVVTLESRDEDGGGDWVDEGESASWNEYDRAVELLKNLRDLAERRDDFVLFGSQMRAVRDRHHGKTSFIRRLDAARFP